MAKVDSKLKTIFIGALLWIAVISAVVGYLHISAENRQARRELIYRKAVHQAAVEKRQRVQEYEKRRRETELQRQLLRGQVVNTAAQRAPAPGQ